MKIGYLRLPMLDAETADEKTSPPINCFGYANLTFYVKGAGTTSSGVITFEEADFDPSTQSDYSGTWSEIATVNASDVTGGQQLAYHVGGPGGSFSYGFVRARISTVIGGGGSISVVAVAS